MSLYFRNPTNDEIYQLTKITKNIFDLHWGASNLYRMESENDFYVVLSNPILTLELRSDIAMKQDEFEKLLRKTINDDTLDFQEKESQNAYMIKV